MEKEDSDSGDIKGGTPFEDVNEIETEWGNEAIDNNADIEEEDGLVQGSVCPAIAFEGHYWLEWLSSSMSFSSRKPTRL